MNSLRCQYDGWTLETANFKIDFVKTLKDLPSSNIPLKLPALHNMAVVPVFGGYKYGKWDRASTERFLTWLWYDQQIAFIVVREASTKRVAISVYDREASTVVHFSSDYAPYPNRFSSPFVSPRQWAQECDPLFHISSRRTIASVLQEYMGKLHYLLINIDPCNNLGMPIAPVAHYQISDR
jgi:hypothetical protein